MQYIENIDVLKMCLDVFNDVAASISQTSCIVGYTTIELLNNNLGQRATLVVFCAGITNGSRLPSKGVVFPFMLRQADTGHQKHHTTFGPADYVHQTLLKLNFILLC